MFAIEPYAAAQLDGMLARYNEQAAVEPHVAPIDGETFERMVAAKSYFDPSGIFVARRSGRVLGWVHACIAPGTEAWQTSGVPHRRIRMLVYEGRELAVGVALVRTATEWLSSREGTPVEAMGASYGYPFYRGLYMGGEPMCPASLAHLHVAFEAAGYQTTERSVFLAADLRAAPPAARPSHDVELRDEPVLMTHDAMAESWRGFEPLQIRAFCAGEPVGMVGWVLLPRSASLGAPAMSIWALGTDERARRRGIAFALVARAMALGHARGSRVASVATQIDNAGARALYAALGFVPHTLLCGRALER